MYKALKLIFIFILHRGTTHPTRHHLICGAYQSDNKNIG